MTNEPQDTSVPVDCRLMQFGVSPYSGNIYTASSCEKALSDFRQRVEDGVAYCEYGMPNPDRQDKLSIDESRVCARLTDIRVDQTGVLARIEPIGPMAKLYQKLMEEDVPHRFAMRAMTQRTDDDAIARIHQIISFDLVSG